MLKHWLVQWFMNNQCKVLMFGCSQYKTPPDLWKLWTQNIVFVQDKWNPQMSEFLFIYQSHCYNKDISQPLNSGTPNGYFWSAVTDLLA